MTHRTADGRMQTESRDSFIAPWKVYLRASLDIGSVRWRGRGERSSHGSGQKRLSVSQAGALAPKIGDMGEDVRLVCTSLG